MRVEPILIVLQTCGDANRSATWRGYCIVDAVLFSHYPPNPFHFCSIDFGMDENQAENTAAASLGTRDKEKSHRREHSRRSKRTVLQNSADDSPGMTLPPFTKGFDVIVRGVLEGAECHAADTLFARTYWVHGTDWTPLMTLTKVNPFTTDFPVLRPLDREAQSEVITQLSYRSDDPFARFTWAAPFECALHSTNPHGWPQLVVTLHTISHAVPDTKVAKGTTSGNSDKCLSYSRCFIPMRSGTYRRKLHLIQLVPSTRKQAWIEWWLGERLELRDPAFLCTGEDRGVLSAAPLPGHVSVSLSVVVNGLAECGIEP